MIILRFMSQSDIPQLYALELATQIAPWPQETFEKCFQAPGFQGWVIMQPAETVIGFICILIQAGECHILNLCIDPDYQRQGHGMQLMQHVLMTAKQQGAEIVYLEVRHSNKKAIALYEKMGFIKIGERKRYYSTAEGHEDAWVFAKKA